MWKKLGKREKKNVYNLQEFIELFTQAWKAKFHALPPHKHDLYLRILVFRSRRCKLPKNYYLFFIYIFAFSTAVPLIYYGLQHYLSLVGSLVLIPLVMVPVMGGTDVSICSYLLFIACYFKKIDSFSYSYLFILH